MLFAGACIAVISILIQQSVAQLSVELEYQTALLQRGIPRIQSAFKATKLQPDNYDYQRVLGKAYASKGYQSQALEGHLLKLQLRPSWPFAWFELAQWHVRNNKLDSDQFNYALGRSIEIGRNEIGLRQARARLALDVLDRDLSPLGKTRLQEALILEFDTRPHYVFAQAALSNQEDVICGYLKDKEGVAKWCGQMERFRRVCAAELAKTKKHRDWCTGMRLVWESWV